MFRADMAASSSSQLISSGQQLWRGRAEEGLGGAERSWWLWEWLCMEVLRDFAKRAVAGL